MSQSGKSTLELHRRPIEDFFLKGPIPFAELIPVGKMPGKTLLVWLLIVHRVTFSKSMWVTLPTYALKEWGISVDAKADALKRLEQGGRSPSSGRKAATSRCGCCGNRRNDR